VKLTVSVGFAAEKITLKTKRGNITNQMRKVPEKKLSEILTAEKRKRGTTQQLTNERDLGGRKKRRGVITEIRKTELGETRRRQANITEEPLKRNYKNQQDCMRIRERMVRLFSYGNYSFLLCRSLGARRA
jgi:hypothetical protein